MPGARGEPDFTERRREEIPHGLGVGRAGEDVPGGRDGEESVHRGAVFVTEPPRDGVVMAEGRGRVPHEGQAPREGLLADAIDEGPDLRVGKEELARGERGEVGPVGPRSRLRDEEVHGEALDPELREEGRQPEEILLVEPVHGGVRLHGDA